MPTMPHRLPRPDVLAAVLTAALGAAAFAATAVAGAGGTPAPPAGADTEPPGLTAARALSTNEVLVQPSEPLDPLSVQVDDFVLTMAGVRRALTGVQVAPDGSSVRLLASAPWIAGEAGDVAFSVDGAVSDLAGNPSVGAHRVRVAAAPGDTVAPTASGARLSPRRFCIHRGSRCRRPGTVLSLNASEPARLRMLVRSGRRALGQRSVDVEAGTNQVRFNGRLPRRTLGLGSYTLELRLEDRVGNVTPRAATIRFSIVRSVAGGPVPDDDDEPGRPLPPIPNAPAPIVGIGDQNPISFSEPLFTALGVRRTRLITPWNSIRTDVERLDAWINAVTEAGLEPLIAFNHAAGDQCPRSPCTLPTPEQVATTFREFRARYPQVTHFQAWNEGNHQSQPTARSPRVAARIYNAMRAVCPTCTIVAADLLDSTNLERWLRDFLRFATGTPRLFGLHNYSDTNRNRSTGTQRMLRAVPRGSEVWITETGGVVSFVTTDGRQTFPFDEARAARSVEHMFRIAQRYKGYITRLYIYHWRAPEPGGNRFDAGLVRADGSPRPSYDIVARNRALIR